MASITSMLVNRPASPKRSISIFRACLLLAVCYFTTGWIGRSLAVLPGYATILWPASGVALCALLAFGRKLWPGILLGSFSFNAVNGLDSSAALIEILATAAVAGAIGLGASAQAIVGLRQARRFADGIELANGPRLLRAFVAVIAAPALIAPTVGVATLFAAGIIPGGLGWSNWLTWYFGDLLGIVLVMPILLLSKWSPVAVSWHGKLLHGFSALVAISLLTTLMLTLYAWQFVSERQFNQAETNFEMVADNTEEALRYRLEIYQRALEGAAAFAGSSGSIDPDQWRAYVERLDIDRAYPGMRGIGFFESVADGDLPDFREKFGSEFGPDFAIHPIVRRPEHFIINRIEPLSRNQSALGLDLAFEEGRRDAIALSTQRDTPVLTRPIVLVQDSRQGPGFLLMLPIRDETGRLTGRWAYAPLVAEELFSSLIPKQGEDFALQMHHVGSADGPKQLYETGEWPADPKFETERTMDLAGQEISLRWANLPPFESRFASAAPAITIVSGLTITVLLGILLVLLLRRESYILREVEAATAELAERNRMLELAEATAHIGHWQLELSSNHLTWSDEVYRLHGLPVGQIPALTEAIEFYHPGDRKTVQDALERAMATGEPYEFTARLIAQDRFKHVEVRGRVDTDDVGAPRSITGVIIDRTDEMQMRKMLTKSIEEARAADEAKSSFLANMSHEIRTPMNGVIGFTELALAEERNPDQKRRLQMIADSGNAMLKLLNDLLDFAKIEAKQMAIVSEPTDLRHTLRSCQSLMEPVARGNGISLTLDVDPAIPSRVMVDKMRLRQIVLNLLGNGLKFTDEGKVAISASVGPGQFDEADRLVISVHDTGIGIPTDRLKSVFGKFTQADDTTARRYGGTGLGLPISAELALLMGGELTAESELGKGSVFTLSLPLVVAAETEPKHAAESPAEYCGLARRLRILVVEDNPINQELTLSMVDTAGHDYDLASDGIEAVDAVLAADKSDRPYDLVLMDMQMPRMDGLHATREIRDAGIGPERLPILAVTANAYGDDIQRCEAAGMQAHLAKPLRLKELCSAIGRWSETEQPAATAQPAAIEEESDPRLRAMYDERIETARQAIDAALAKQQLTEEDTSQIAGQLHQIAGIAAYFGQEPLGEFCRKVQRDLSDASDDALVAELLKSVRTRIGEPDRV